MARYVALVFASVLISSGLAAANITDGAQRQAAGQRHQGGWMASDANPSHPWLYVAGFYNSVIEIHDLSRVGMPLAGRIRDGIKHPAGIALDRQGTLYVANENGTVSVYIAGTTTPSLTLSQGLNEAICVAVAANGDVYVGNRSASAPRIVVYPQGQTVPSEIITSPLITNPIAEFFDANGNLYISDFNMGVSMIPSGSQQPRSLGLQGAFHTQGIALDPTNGNLLVNVFESSTVYETLVYPPGSVNPSRTLKGGNIAANYIAIGAIKRALDVVFLPNGFSTTVQTWKRGGNKPWFTISTGANGAEGVAYKPAGVP